MASYPPIFVTINGTMLNATDIQKARPLEGDESDGIKVFFISGGWVILRDITVEQLQAVLSLAAKEAAPF